MNPKRQSTLAIIGMLILLLGAAWLRITHYSQWLPGLSLDQGVDGVDALFMTQTGTFPAYVPDGRLEIIMRLVQSGAVALFGRSVFAVRIPSWFLGVLSVAAAYRAGRHLVPLSHGRWARILAGLLAAGAMAAMLGNIAQSRLTYRGIQLPVSLLLFVDAFVVAWRGRRPRDFLAAGMWLGFVCMSYSSGWASLIAVALGVVHQGIFSRRQGEGEPWWRGTLLMGVALLAIASSLLLLIIMQPNYFFRVQEITRLSTGRTPGTVIMTAVRKLPRVWENIGGSGDINPQYNIDSAPLLDMAPLYWLFLLGCVACALRWRRSVGWLSIALVGAFLLPVAVGNEVPHGLRIVGEMGAVPLVVAASIDPLAWLVNRIPYVRWQRAARVTLTIALVALISAAGVQSARKMIAYYGGDLRWGDARVPAYSWFFETKRETVADSAASLGGVSYVPLAQANHPSMRYFLARRYPHIASYATYFGSDGPLYLPPGRIYLTGDAKAATYVALMPDGTIVMLPRFDDDTLAVLKDRASREGTRLDDPYGEYAATIVDVPDGFTIDQPIAHPVQINYGDQVTLVGWDSPDTLPADGGDIRVTLYFAAGPRLGRIPTQFVQLWGREMNRLDGAPQEPVLRWLYPTEQWRPGDIVPVEVVEPVPAELASGVYYLAVGMLDYRGEPLSVLGADGAPVADTAIAGTLKEPRTEAPSTEGMIPASAEFSDQIALIGYRITDETGMEIDFLMPGQSATVTLYWQAIRRPDADYTAFLHVVDPSGEIAAQSDVQPEGGAYPTAIWDAGEIVTTTHPITVPAEASDPFTLYTGWYSFPDLVRLPVTQNGAPSPDDRAVVVALDSP